MPGDVRKATVHHKSAHATAADHAVTAESQYLVSPASAAQSTWNTIRLPLLPWACWKAEDICFDFDRAFVRPDAKTGFTELASDTIFAHVVDEFQCDSGLPRTGICDEATMAKLKEQHGS